jgi:hypothetical protein
LPDVSSRLFKKPVTLLGELENEIQRIIKELEIREKKDES